MKNIFALLSMTFLMSFGFSAHAQIQDQGLTTDGQFSSEGSTQSSDFDAVFGMDHGHHGGGHHGGGHHGGGHGGGYYQWVYSGVDHKGGCNSCQYSCYDSPPCGPYNLGARMSCPVPGTKDDDYVYTCVRY